MLILILLDMKVMMLMIYYLKNAILIYPHFRSLLEDKEFRNNTLLVLDGYDELPFTADRGQT